MAGEELGTAFFNGLQDDPFARAAARLRQPYSRPAVPPLEAQPTQPVQQAPLGPLPTPEDIAALNRVTRPPQPWQGASPRIAQPPASPEQDFMRVVQQQAQQPPQPAWQRNLSPAQIAVANAIEAGGRKVDEVVGPAIPPELRAKGQSMLQAANAMDPLQAAARVGPNIVAGKYGDAALDFLGAIPGEHLVAGAAKLAALGKAAPAMFLGVGAKGADLAKLKQAEKLELAGTPMEQIRQQTGWDRERGGKWQFEISDKGARYTPQPQPNRLEIAQDIFEAETGLPRTKFATGGVHAEPTRLALQKADAQIRMEADQPKRLGDYLHHPELYAAEPRLADIETQQVPAIASGRGGARGSYSSVAGEKGGEPSIAFAETLGPGGPRKTLLHEASHAADDLYGFPPGANNLFLSPGTPGWTIYQERLKAIRTPQTRAEFEASGVHGPDFPYEEYLKQHRSSIRNPEKMRMFDRAAQEYAVQEGYKRSAGEAKARNVERRSDMTPEELAATSPRATEDVPFEKQIVTKRTAGDEAAEMATGRPPRSHNNPPELIQIGPEDIKGGRRDSGFSKVQAGTPTTEMEFKIKDAQTHERKIMPIDKAIKVGDEIIPLVGDRTRKGGRLTQVGDVKFENKKGYLQEGGPDYAMGQDVGEGGLQRVWGNAAGNATALFNLGKQIQERGRNPVLMYLTMNKEGGDFSKQMFGPVHDWLRQHPLSPQLNEIIDRNMLKDWNGAKPIKDWPGLGSKEIEEYLANAPGPVRAKLTKALDAKRVIKEGGPDIGALRVAITNPQLYNTPTAYMGYHIADFDPSKTGVSAGHTSYPVASMGTNVRGLGGSVPGELVLPDLYKVLQQMGAIKKRPDLFEQRLDYYANKPPNEKAKKMKLDPAPRAQVVNQEMIDKLAAWVEKNGLKSIPPAMITALAGLGLAGGGEAQAQEMNYGR